ncbi:MAG: hypothetical protein WCY58_08990 [Mariniphaga sp.]|nr:hypothetical protein [Mariniphaga sp.]MDD4424685.1 hypothetical protein [Mariniphaga sp.]
MEIPFVFGKLAVDKDFTNRQEERKRLISNFSKLVNSVILSPPSWGKSSLVWKAAGEAVKSDKNLRFCFINAFDMQSEEQFYCTLATEVLKASANKMRVLNDHANELLGRYQPKLSFVEDNPNEFTLHLDEKEVKAQPDEILQLTEKIAAQHGLKFILCIDEFQHVSTFENTLLFQKRLRAAWQKYQHTAFCLYGNKYQMLNLIFADSSMPFYKFGDQLYLERIDQEEWIRFISKRFRDTKKSITKRTAAFIAALAECHPFYVQQLAQQCWFRTVDSCSAEIVRDAHEGLIDQLSLFFWSKTGELSGSYIQFLRALLHGVEQFSSKEVMKEYHLGTSANVVKIKKMLESKEIIELNGKKIIMLDPIYKSWLKSRYFKIN